MLPLRCSTSGCQPGTTSTSATRAPTSAPHFAMSSSVATRASSVVTDIRSLIDRPGRSLASVGVGWSAYMWVPLGITTFVAASASTSVE
jgi:hypothetical protein